MRHLYVSYYYVFIPETGVMACSIESSVTSDILSVSDIGVTSSKKEIKALLLIVLIDTHHNHSVTHWLY